MAFLKYLKVTSVLSSLTESEDEQHLLLHHGWRHTKCSCIPSAVHTTALRNRRNEKQKHPFLERISHVANTGIKLWTRIQRSFFDAGLIRSSRYTLIWFVDCKRKALL